MHHYQQTKLEYFKPGDLVKAIHFDFNWVGVVVAESINTREYVRVYGPKTCMSDTYKLECDNTGHLLTFHVSNLKLVLV